MKSTALIIGPGSAFGYELCESLSKTYDVISISRSRADLPETVTQSRADIGSTEYDRLVSQIIENNQVSVVVYAAKFSPHGGVNLDSNELMRSYVVNVVGMQRILSILSRAQRANVHVHFIVIGGGYKDIPHRNKIALSSSKAAIHNIVLALQDECIERGILLHELVIDGKITSDGDIRPADVVREILNMTTYKEPLIKQISQMN
jgi:short-subunit dehydrogenase